MITLNQFTGLLLRRFVHCVTPDHFSHQNRSCKFKNLPFHREWNIAAITGLTLRLNNSRFSIKSKEGSVTLSVLTLHLDFNHFPSGVKRLPSVFSMTIFMLVVIMNFPPWYIDRVNLSITTRLTTRSHRFTARYNSKFYGNSFFSQFSPWELSIGFLSRCHLQSSKI